MVDWVVKKKRAFGDSYYFHKVSPQKLVEKIFPPGNIKPQNGNRQAPVSATQVYSMLIIFLR